MSHHNESHHLRTFLRLHHDIQQCHLAINLLTRSLDRLEYQLQTSIHALHRATTDIADLTALLHGAASRHHRALTRKNANVLLSEDEWLKNQDNLRGADLDVNEYTERLKEAREKQRIAGEKIKAAEKEMKRKKEEKRWEEKKRWMWEAEFQYGIEGFGVRVNRKGELEVFESEGDARGEEGWTVVEAAVYVSSRVNGGVGQEGDSEEEVMGGLDKVRRWDPAPAEMVTRG